MAGRKFFFVSTNWAAPWGGSESLWSQTALALVDAGHAAAASVYRWPKPAKQLSVLQQAGVRVHARGWPAAGLRPRLLQKAVRFIGLRISLRAVAKLIRRERPDLICLSLGSPDEDTVLMEICVDSGVPYVVVLQANSEHIWPDDARATVLRRVFQRAQRCFFVSQGNRALLETQLGLDLPNAEIVRNPFNVRPAAAIPWPVEKDCIKFACVGRLDPRAKGQDLVLRALARETWCSRNFEISFFGEGEMRAGLRRLADRLRIGDRVRFGGHVEKIENVWADHHILILPSRFEGLPLVVVEAMLCGRPVIVTDVAGNSEIVEDGVTGFVAESPTVAHLNAAMERAWKQRSNWETMGTGAAAAIKKLVPENPAAVFGRRLLELTGI